MMEDGTHHDVLHRLNALPRSANDSSTDAIIKSLAPKQHLPMQEYPSEILMALSQIVIREMRNMRGQMTVDLSTTPVHVRCWREIVEEFKLHSTLKKVAFPKFAGDCGPLTLQLKRDITKAVANMLSVNQQIEEIPFDDRTFDRELWDVIVIPRLDCNLYRERFLPLQKIKEQSTRAALVAKALARVESKPWLVSMLLSHNRDILSSYLINL
jgi:hypothetical protein